VDPVIQFPTNSQSLNPYSYLMNNPMAGTDPTGYCMAETGTHIKSCVNVSAKMEGDTTSRSLGSYNLRNPGDIARADRVAIPGLDRNGAAGQTSSGTAGSSRSVSDVGAVSGTKSPEAATVVGTGSQFADTALTAVAASAFAANSGDNQMVWANKVAALQAKFPQISRDTIEAAYKFLAAENPKSAYASGEPNTEYSTVLLDRGDGNGIVSTGKFQGTAGQTKWTVLASERSFIVGLPHTHGYGGDFTNDYFSADDVRASTAFGRSVPVFLSTAEGAFRVFYPGMPLGGRLSGSSFKLPGGAAQGFLLCSACVPTRPSP
jgi:hypothetical protein